MAVWKANAMVKSSSMNSNTYDYVQAFVKSRTNNPVIINELITAYTLIANNLGININQFLQLVESQGTTYEQDLYLANYLNTVRVKNSLLGVVRNVGTPLYIQREIQV